MLPQETESRWSPDEARTLLLQLKGAYSQTYIANVTGIDQGQVSRLLSGKFVRVTGNALRLCKYADMVLRTTPTGAAQLREKLVTSALSLWDGSEISAARTITLLDALRPIIKASAQD